MEVKFFVKYNPSFCKGLARVLLYWAEGSRSGFFSGGLPPGEKELYKLSGISTKFVQEFIKARNWLLCKSDQMPQEEISLVATSGGVVIKFYSHGVGFDYEGRRGALNGYGEASVSPYLFKIRKLLRNEEVRENLTILNFISSENTREWWDSTGCPERNKGESPYFAHDHRSW